MSDTFETISVVGLGYIGLPTATLFASRGKKVIGVDVSPRAVSTINQGRIHIVEPVLQDIVAKVVAEGNLRAVSKPEPANAFLIAVPTPFQNDHEPDVSFVKAAAKSIASVLKRGDLVILESTSPVGTTEQLVEWLAAERTDLKFPHSPNDKPDVNVAYCPERVLPGQIVKELVENDRIIGGITAECSRRAMNLYRIFVEGELSPTDARTAEMCKLTENSFRDVNIAFANELSLICDKLGINVWELIGLANRHPRVKILQPGTGVGGHCIAVDPWFIVDKTPEQARIIRTAREINDGKPEWVRSKIDAAAKSIESGGRAGQSVKVAILGLAYKPNVDDLRESPALHIAESLHHSDEWDLMLVEPNVSELPKSLGNRPLVDVNKALKDADVVAILVSHSDFKGLRPREGQIFVDAVGLTNSQLTTP